MRHKVAIDRLIGDIAEKQHGVIATPQLLAGGLSRSGIARRVREGRLHRLHRGVYAVGHAGISKEGRWMAALLAFAAGGVLCSGAARSERDDPDATMPVLEYWGAALSHRSAAELWGLLPARNGLVNVSVLGDGGRARRTGIRLHRSLTLLPASVTIRSGIPVTTPARTIADLRRASVGKRRSIAPRELRRAIRQANVLGLPVGEEDRCRRERSDLEEDFLALCRRHRLPMPEVNVRVGEHLVDFLWREKRLIVETDGYIYHRGRAAFEDDRTRDLSLRALGYEVMHFADIQIEGEPGQIAAVLRPRLASFPSHRPESRQAAP
jgi:very-short-patch-repair endonuclease